MTFIQHYDSPFGDILLAADDIGLTGLWFDGAKYYADNLPEKHAANETPILAEVRRWLDIYFDGRKPDFTPPLNPIGSRFRKDVWEILLQIPYGQTVTYGDIALPKSGDLPGCPRRLWAARSGTIKFPSLFLVIGSSVQTAA